MLLLVLFIAAIIASGIVWIVYVEVKRVNAVKSLQSRLGANKTIVKANSSQEAVARALKDLETKNSQDIISKFRNLLLATGIETNPILVFVLMIGFATFSASLVAIVSSAIIFSVLIWFVVLGLPIFVLKYLAGKRTKLFLEDFGPSVDVMIRGLRNGLSITQAIKLLADEGSPAISLEFQKLFNDLEFGLSMEEAVERLCDRIDAPEVRFFSIVIGIQSKSGGNLSSALGNLSDLLRKRKELKGKIKSLSSEAKTSAWIIGALPVLVILVVSLTSPDYIAVFFETSLGNLILAGCATWMAIGIFVMSQMIKLED